MTLPGTTLEMEDVLDPAGALLRLATPFIVAETERGPETVVRLRSMRDLRRYFGERTATSAAIHDWLETYWWLGGGVAYLRRRLGPAAKAAEATFTDGAATAITVRMREKGVFGDEFDADIDVSGGSFTVRLLRNGVEIENSGNLADGAAATAWAAESSSWVEIIDGPGGNPTATATPTALTQGADDLGNVTDTETRTAIEAFDTALGTGVYVLVGITNTSAQVIAGEVARKRNRLARCDLPNSSSAQTLAAHAATLRASGNGDVMDLLAPPLTVPGLTPATTRIVPASVLRCAAEAVNDRAGISPNQPAAGVWGAPSKPGVTPLYEWGDDDRETLNDAGVNIVRVIDRQTRLYGARTAVDPDANPAGLRLGSARLRMWLAEVSRYESESTNFAELDAGGVVLGDLEGRIAGKITGAWPRSVYFLDVAAELVEDEDQPGQYVVDVVVEFQAAPDAERVRVRIQRSTTEV